MFQNPFRKRGRPLEHLQIGGYDNPIQQQQEQNQIPVHQSLVPLNEPRQLPLQPVREFDHDVVMRDRNTAEPKLNIQVETQHLVIDDQSRQDNMLAHNPPQVTNPNQATLRENQRGAKKFQTCFRSFFGSCSAFFKPFSCQIKNVSGAVSFCRRATLINKASKPTSVNVLSNGGIWWIRKLSYLATQRFGGFEGSSCFAMTVFEGLEGDTLKW